MNPSSQIEKDNLVKKLHAKIGERVIGRSSKKRKEHILDETFGKLGIDRTQLQQSVDLLKKLGPNERKALLESRMNLPSGLPQ
jgi:hypothetical protein